MVILNKIVLYIASSHTVAALLAKGKWTGKSWGETKSTGNNSLKCLGTRGMSKATSGTGSLFVIPCNPILILIIHFNSLCTCGYILGSIYSSRFSYGFSEKSLMSLIPPSFHLLTCPPLPNSNLSLPVHNFHLRPYTSAGLLLPFMTPSDILTSGSIPNEKHIPNTHKWKKTYNVYLSRPGLSQSGFSPGSPFYTLILLLLLAEK